MIGGPPNNIDIRPIQTFDSIVLWACVALSMYSTETKPLSSTTVILASLVSFLVVEVEELDAAEVRRLHSRSRCVK